ncbi:MAG: outer membrane beta-barrel protein [Prevotella sp.]|nr:outer membrane beta-barrel protein [Prevotella sp.]
MVRLIACFTLCCFTTSLRAQSDPEYLMEIGGGAGLTGYLGDFNGKLTRDLQPMASVVARRLLNPWAGFKFNASWGKLKSSSADAESYLPEFRDDQLSPTREGLPYTFSNTLVDVSAVFEYNFLPYGTGRDYRGAKRLVPFIFGGLGGTFVNGGGKSTFTGNVPIGLGMKYKIADRLNLGVEWAIHFSLSDELDGVKDPYNIKSTGAFKNTDCYQALQVTLTYSFMARCRTCHNADEN